MISTQVLQYSIDNQLKLYMKGSPVPVAQVTVNSLTRFSKSQCAVPENIHTPPTEKIGISWGWGVLQGEKI